MVREEIKIPKSISDFVAEATLDYEDLGANIEQLYAAKISQNQLEYGSGICLKMEEVPLNGKSPNPDQSAIRFMLSDGNFAVECMAHNGSIDARPGGMESDRLRRTMMMLTESISDGSQLCVSGGGPHRYPRQVRPQLWADKGCPIIFPVTSPKVGCDQRSDCS